MSGRGGFKYYWVQWGPCSQKGWEPLLLTPKEATLRQRVFLSSFVIRSRHKSASKFICHLTLHWFLLRASERRGPNALRRRSLAIGCRCLSCRERRAAICEGGVKIHPSAVPFRHVWGLVVSTHTYPRCEDEKHLLSPLCGAVRAPDGGIKHAWVARSSENNYTHLLETERVHPTKSPPIIETSSRHTNEGTRQWPPGRVRMCTAIVVASCDSHVNIFLP